MADQSIGSQVRFVITDPHSVPSQAKIIVQGMKSKIANALVATLQTVPQLQYVAFDQIRLLASDFKDHELPAVQIIDVSAEHKHEVTRSKYFWQLAIEILMKSTEHNTVSQQDLWNLEYEVKRAIFEYPNLQVQGVVHCNLLGTATDLHLLNPYYFARLDLRVDFYEDAVRPC